VNGGARPFVSVIIPAFGNRETLARCLAALERQTWPAEWYEVIVVDNGSPEDLSAVVSGAAGARLEAEPRPGSYAARNRGVAAARGNVFAFTDSDCIPEPGWIERGVAALAACPEPCFAAGRVDMFARDPAHPTAAEHYDLVVMNFRQESNVAERGFGATANLFARAGDFRRVGPFDDQLLSGGDLEWGRRALALGFRGLYADDARVRHPARRTMAETLARAARLVGGTHRLGARGGASPLRNAVDLVRSLTPAVHFYWRILRAGEPPRFADRGKVVLVALTVKYAGAWERIRLGLGGAPHRG
jgi:glycosyltransferase involved in cell wall biosynthesis